MIFLSRSSNSPRYLVPATSEPMSSVRTRLSMQRLRHVAGDDALRQALGDGRLADARLADQGRVVLGPAAEDLDDPLDLLLAADDRVDLAGARPRRSGRCPAGRWSGSCWRAWSPRPGRARRLGQDVDDLVADLVQVHAEALEHARGDALAFTHKAQQQVLRADVVVAQATRLVDRQLDHALGARGQADFADDRSIATPDDELDRRADLGQLDVHVLEHARGDALALADEARAGDAPCRCSCG